MGDDNRMDFLSAAFPWIAMGLIVAFVTAYYGKKGESQRKDQP